MNISLSAILVSGWLLLTLYGQAVFAGTSKQNQSADSAVGRYHLTPSSVIPATPPSCDRMTPLSAPKPMSEAQRSLLLQALADKHLLTIGKAAVVNPARSWPLNCSKLQHDEAS